MPFSIQLSPSILNADFALLEQQVRAVESEKADFLHLDVMDGHYVPNLTFGPPVIKALRKVTKMKMDAHLMIENAEASLEGYAEAGVQHITVHFEAVKHLDAAISRIKALGCTAGVALNPATPVEVLDQILPEIDLVLVMTVNPGFGGQHFIPYCLEKIRKMRAQINALGKDIELQVDGGIKLENLNAVLKAGAGHLVVGSAIFQGDPVQNYRAFKRIITRHLSV
jgi:ribulose-phosphate 3-epimerase